MSQSNGLQFRVAAPLAMAAWFALLPASVAATGELSYAGTWTCDASPTMIAPNVSVPASALRAGDQLTVTRVVHHRVTGQEAGRLVGKATVRDGRVSFEATTTGALAVITARMTGTVSDSEIVLTGSERVRLLADGREDDRACRARLTRP